MTCATSPFEALLREHGALLSQYGAVQLRCDRLMAAQRARIAELEAGMVRLRGALIARDTALACEREDRLALEAMIPGLPRRAALARRAEALLERIQGLMRERLHWQWHSERHSEGRAGTDSESEDAMAPVELAAVPLDIHRKAVLCIGQDAPASNATQRVVERAGGQFLHHDGADADDAAELEASLRAADLVICQTGCISHNAYWRVQDHCKRTGKQCVLVNEPQPLRFVSRIERETPVF